MGIELEPTTVFVMQLKLQTVHKHLNVGIEKIKKKLVKPDKM